MINRLKNIFKKKQPEKPQPKKKKLSPKEEATKNGEPWVDIIKVDVDPNNINNGSFELDWNDKFLTNLIKQGYQLKPDEDENVIVDRWFQTVCRNIAMEIYEQDQADPSNRSASDMRVIQQRDLGNGRTEVS